MPLAVLQPYDVTIWGDSADRPLYRLTVQAFSEGEAKADGLASFARTHVIAEKPQPKVTRVEVTSYSAKSSARAQQTLFERLAEACIGDNMTDVQGAAVNLLLTVVQRASAKLPDAEKRWDELMGRGKVALQRRYATGQSDTPAETEIAKRIGMG